MIRLGKLTDYGLVLMTYIARNHDRSLHTARVLSVESRLPLPTVSKLLKELLEGGLLVSHRGVKGGYSLAKLGRRERSQWLKSLLYSRILSRSLNVALTSPACATWSPVVRSRTISGSSVRRCAGHWRRCCFPISVNPYT